MNIATAPHTSMHIDRAGSSLVAATSPRHLPGKLRGGTGEAREAQCGENDEKEEKNEQRREEGDKDEDQLKYTVKVDFAS